MHSLQYVLHMYVRHLRTISYYITQQFKENSPLTKTVSQTDLAICITVRSMTKQLINTFIMISEHVQYTYTILHSGVQLDFLVAGICYYIKR